MTQSKSIPPRQEKSTTVRALFAPLKFLARLSPELGGRVAFHYFTKPRRFPRPEREQAVQQNAKRFRLLADVMGYEWGTGPTVLLVHGWEGRASQLGQFVQPLVAAGYRVVSFDARAHGDSQGSHTTILGFREAILAIERRYPLHAAIAHSFGGPALALALQQGLQLNAAVLIAPPAALDNTPEQFAQFTGLGQRGARALKTHLERKLRLSFSTLRVRNYGPAMRSPLLVIHDLADQDVPSESAQQYMQYWQGCELYQTEGLGHRRILRDPSVVERAVHFIRKEPLHHCGHVLERWWEDSQHKHAQSTP